MSKKHLYLAILLVVIVKAITLVFIVHYDMIEAPSSFDGIAKMSGDAPEYIEPLENYLQSGYYSYKDDKHYLGRTPFYGLFFVFFRLFFSKTIALSFLVIAQIILEIFSIILLGKLIFYFTNRMKSFWFVIILMSISSHVTYYSHSILTESLSISFCVFSIYYFHKYLQFGKKRNFLISSLFFGYLVALKPYFGLFYLIFGLMFLLNEKGRFLIKIKKSTLKTVWFFIPLIVFILPWTIRNYYVHDRIIVFNEYNYSETYVSYRDFIRCRGESFVDWDHSSAGCYFTIKDIPCSFKIPEHFLCKGCSIKDVNEARDLYVEYLRNPENKVVAKKAREKFDELNRAYRNEKPFEYYIGSRFRVLKIFLFHSGSYYLPYVFSELNIFGKIYKLLQSLLYYLALLIGIPFLIFLCVKNKAYILLAGVPILLIVLFPIVLQASEWRFFAPFYPFGMLGLAIFIEKVWEQLEKYFFK